MKELHYTLKLPGGTCIQYSSVFTHEQTEEKRGWNNGVKCSRKKQLEEKGFIVLGDGLSMSTTNPTANNKQKGLDMSSYEILAVFVNGLEIIIRKVGH